jgi:hypothetical protein
MSSARRRGAALTQVIVLSLVLLAAATAVIRWQLQRHRQASNNLLNSQLKGDVEALRNSINACLAGTGYPAAGTCTPSAAQAACVPAGVIAVFGGTPPACELKITAAR